MIAFLKIVLFLLGLFFIVYQKGKSVLLYLLFVNVYAPFIIDCFIPLSTEDYSSIQSVVNILSLLLLFYNICFRKITFRNKVLIILLSGLFIYSFLISYIRNASIISMFRYLYGTVGNICFLINLLIIKPDIFKYKNWIDTTLKIEILLGLLQMLGFMNYEFTAHTVKNTAYITGTLIGNNAYATFLWVLLMSNLYINFIKERKVTLFDLSKIIVVFFLIFQTGIRTPLLVFAIALVILFYCSFKGHCHIFKRHRFAIISASVIAVAVIVIYKPWNSINQADVKFDNQVETAAERQNAMLNVFLRDDYLLNHTTLAYSLDVISYLPNNYLIGPGLYTSTKYGYGGVVNKETENFTDATLAVFICELGLLGFILIIVIYSYIFIYINKRRKGFYVIFIPLLITTITDIGLFYLTNTAILFITIVIEGQMESQKI